MIEYLNQIDQDWVVFLNNLGSDTWDSFWLFITDKWGAEIGRASCRERV